MSKKKRQTPRTIDKQTDSASSSTMRASYKTPGWIIFFASVVVYIHTIGFDYALDDKLYVTHNQFTKQGLSGIKDLATNDLLVGFFGKDKKLLSGGRYRPLPLITFALEVEMFGQNPHISHFVNLILYGATCVLLFLILIKIFPPEKERHWARSLAFGATLLFALHPLHTEVIANIKSRDEMMSLLGALGSLWFLLRYADTPSTKALGWAFLCFTCALFSKESTVTMLGAIPVTLFYFSGKDLKTQVRMAAPLFLAFAGYMVVRLSLLEDNTQEVHELLNNSYEEATGAQKYATIFYTMGLYIKLLIFPHPLTNDYFPYHISLVNWSHPLVLLSLLIYASMIVVGLRGIRKRTVASWAIWFFLITFSLFTNLVFPIGSFMNERFMYVPSIAFCVLAAYTLGPVLRNRFSTEAAHQKFYTAVAGIVLFAFAIKTAHRSNAWKDDYTLSITDVALSPNSTKANMSAGAALLEKANALQDQNQRHALANEAIGYLNRSLQIYPNYKQPMLLLGNAYYMLGQYETAYLGYSRALQMDNQFKDAKNNLEFLGDTTSGARQFQVAEKCYLTLLQYTPDDVRVYGKLGQLYGRDLGDMAKAQSYLEKAMNIDPNNSDILQKLAIVYSLTGNNNEALETFLKAYRLNPKNAHVLMNIGITYRNMGDEAKATEYLNQAFELNPSLQKR
ncbi:MAG: tetratricopeptide repeat protein [Flavobacteriales bacterium]|nr:tetratricopeptide repeat protein [Flavobacteriales bacterium]